MKNVEAQLSSIMNLTDSPTGNPDTDLKKAIDDIKKDALGIYNLALKKVANYQKELDKIANELEQGIKNKGILGVMTNALVARPIIKIIKSLVSLNPSEVADQLSENTLLNVYDFLDNSNVIPEDAYLQTISNFYDWVQVLADIKPFLNNKTVDPYNYIEAATDLLYALKESTVVGQIPQVDVLNSSLMSAWMFSKVGAPFVRYKGNPKGGLKIIGLPLEEDKTKITKVFSDFNNSVNKEINDAILNGKTKTFEIVNELANKFSWVKTFLEKSDLSANELYLMEHTKDIIINKLKIYNIVLRTFKTFKNGQKWGIIKAQVNWDALSQQDKEFVNALIERFKKTNL